MLNRRFRTAQRGGRIGNDILHCEGLEDDRRGGRTLQKRGECHTEQYSQDRILKRSQERTESGCLSERRDGGLHQSDALEEHTESENDGTDFFKRSLFEKQVHDSADEQDHRCVSADVERSDLRRHGRTDISAHYDADCLSQRHEAGRNETDDHDIGGRGTLHEDRHGNTREDRGDFVCGCFAQDYLEIVSAGVLKPARHDRHAVQEQSHSSEQNEYIIDRHGNPFLRCTMVICSQIYITL